MQLSMPSPWYRSRLFWFGLPGLLFLLWIWLGLLRKEAGIRWGNDHADYFLGWGQATIAAGIIKHPPSVGGPPEVGFRAESEDLPADEETVIFVFPPVWAPEDRTMIDVANWLVLVVYLIIWVSALVIWQRRKCGFYQKVLTSRTPDTP